MNLKAWAESHGVSTAPTPPAVGDYDEPCPIAGRDIAQRVLVLQGVVAVAAGVEAEPVSRWLREQHLWGQVSQREAAFLARPSSVNEQVLLSFQWQMEAEWTLLWVIGKVDALGLPSQRCDSRRLCEEIVPELGSDVTGFLDSALVRPPGILLAEDDRHYNLWCYFNLARRKGEPVPVDLNEQILYQRVYALEWLHGFDRWDDVHCDC